MKAVWVLEDIKKTDKFFLHEIELLCLIASVANWRKIYPEIPRLLFCSKSVYNYLENLQVTDLWDEIDSQILETEDEVIRKSFWAASKIKCIKHLNDSFILLDCDFFFKKKCLDIRDLNKIDVLVSHPEKSSVIYPSIRDELLRDLVANYQIRYKWESSFALNVSLLYLRDPYLMKEYAETAWYWMEKISEDYKDHPNLNGKYMIFCEQKLLKEICDIRKKKISVLSLGSLGKEETENEEIRSLELIENIDYSHLHNKKRDVLVNQNLFLDVKSDIIKSIVDLESFSTKLLHQIIIKNKQGPVA